MGGVSGVLIDRPQAGQASVELVGAVVVLVLVVAALWQGLRIAQARWLTAGAARAAARAAAIGSDPLAAARRQLPPRLRSRVRVVLSPGDEGGVRVIVPLPPLIGVRLGALEAGARMEPQR